MTDKPTTTGNPKRFGHFPPQKFCCLFLPPRCLPLHPLLFLTSQPLLRPYIPKPELGFLHIYLNSNCSLLLSERTVTSSTFCCFRFWRGRLQGESLGSFKAEVVLLFTGRTIFFQKLHYLTCHLHQLLHDFLFAFFTGHVTSSCSFLALPFDRILEWITQRGMPSILT